MNESETIKVLVGLALHCGELGQLWLWKKLIDGRLKQSCSSNAVSEHPFMIETYFRLHRRAYDSQGKGGCAFVTAKGAALTDVMNSTVLAHRCPSAQAGGSCGAGVGVTVCFSRGVFGTAPGTEYQCSVGLSVSVRFRHAHMPG